MRGLLRHSAKRLAGTAAVGRTLRLLESRDRGGNVLRVLTYHRVVQPEQHPFAYPGVISATPAEFASQMEYLAASYHVVSMDEVLQAFAGGPELPPRAVLLTFDDAYRDFEELAWPVLRRLGLPVVLFVPTAYPDEPGRVFWWDRLHRASLLTRRDVLQTPAGLLRFATPADRRQSSRRLNECVKSLEHDAAIDLVDRVCAELGVPSAEGETMSWSGLRRVAGEGVSLAPHTQTHPLMHRLSPERATAEAVASWHDLEREVEDPAPVFAYPGGGHNAAVVEQMRAAPFALAFTTDPGANRVPTADPMRVARINVSREMSTAILRARLQLSRLQRPSPG